jgi:hypothetical protein
MSAIPQPSLVSDVLIRPLRRVAARRWWLVAATGLLQLFIVACTVVLATALVLGTFSELTVTSRIALSAFAWATLIISLLTFLKPAFARRPLSAVAREVESTLNDRRELLSSAVELCATTEADADARFAGSPELVAHVVRQAESAARDVDPRRLVPMKGLGRWSMALFLVLLCWAVLIPSMPVPLLRGLYLLRRPWRGDVPAALAAVSVAPGDVTIAEGDPLQFTVAIGQRLRNKPAVPGAQLVARYAGGQTQTLDMNRSGPRSFQLEMQRLVAGFTYRIISDDGSSPWYSVKVMPRPALASVDVHYSYPKYTKLPEKDEPRKDGTIDALVGAEANITIHATQPLSGRSRLIFGEKTAEQRSVLLAAGPDPSARIATIPISRSMPYRIELVNSDDLADAGEIIRQITARPDNPPAVTITSPAAKITATIEETIPVRFTASDDFGLTKLQAIVQIDGQSPQTIDIPFAADVNKTSGVWNLVLPEQLALKKLSDANYVEYQLKASDNRDPNAQTGVSPRQMIEIDHSFKQSFAAKRDAESAKAMTEAIRKAIKDVAAEKAKLDPLVKNGADRLFTASMKKAAASAKDSIDSTAAELAKAVKENQEGPLADVAEAAKAIAEQEIRPAAEEAATAVMNVDQIAQRQEALAAAAAKLDEARKGLEALLEQAKTEAKQQELARSFEDMARRERDVARELTGKPNQQQRDRASQQQQALRQRLDEVLNQNPQLNEQQAREAAQRNQQLARRIEELQEQQKRLEGLAEKQQAVDEARAPLAGLAQEQKELNKQITALAKKDEAPLQDANAQVPDKGRLDNIVEALKNADRIPEGVQQMRQSAGELKQASQRLADASQPSRDNPVNRREATDRKDAERAKAAAKEATVIGKQIEAAKDAKEQERAKEQIQQKEQQLVQRLEQQAAEMKSHDPSQKEAIEAAQEAIAQAKNAAQNGDPQKADEQLAEAAAKLAGAAEADAASAKAERQEMTAAAKQVDALSQKQQELADHAAKSAEAVARARQQQGDPQQLERGERQAAEQAQGVGNEAAEAAERDRGQGEGEMAARAAAAQQALREARQHETATAEAAKADQPQKASAQQEASEQALAQAEAAIRGESNSNAADASASPQEQMKQAAASAQEARAAQDEAMNGRADAASQAARALSQAAKAAQSASRQQFAQMAANNPALGRAMQQQQQQTQPTPGQGEEAGQSPSRPSTPSQTPDSREGVNVTSVARVDGRPEAVKEIGISASDWARLPPLAQQQLLNAAQQSGPPGYQQQIKNYFVKIAKFEAEGSDANAK